MYTQATRRRRTFRFPGRDDAGTLSFMAAALVCVLVGSPIDRTLLTDGFTIDGATVGRLFTDWFDRWIITLFEGNVLRGEEATDHDTDAGLFELIKKIREAYYPD